MPRKDGAVAPVEYHTGQDFTLHERARCCLDLWGCAVSYIVNIHVLQAVGHACIHVLVERFAYLDRKPIIALVIFRAQVVCLVKKELTTDRQLPIKEIRLGQCQNEILSERAVLQAHSKLLTPSSQPRPVRNIEISLGQFYEADQLVNRAESSAEAKGAGALLFHQDRKVFATGYVGVFRICFDFGKIAKVLEAFLSRFHPNRIKD